MNSITSTLRTQINKYEYISERIDYLKDKYKDKICVILAPGPSLNDHDNKRLNEILNDDRFVVLSIKQAFNWCPNNTDFHIMNTWNFDKVNGYNYPNETIVFFGLSKSYMKEQAAKIAIKPSRCDLWIPIVNPPFIDSSQAIQNTKNYDKFFELETNYEMFWGKSIMYEQAIPLGILFGCKKFITIGWDIGNPNLGKDQGHAYSNNTMKSIPSDKNDIIEASDSTKELYDWFVKQNIDFKILSNTNPADNRFERLNSIDELLNFY